MKRSGFKPRTTLMKSNGFARSERIEDREVTKLVAKEKKRRTRKCELKSCRKPFEPRSMTHKACGPECAQELARLKREVSDRKERQAGLAKLRTKRDYVKALQVVFNAYIRLRDQLAGHPCISSGRPLDWSGNGVDAGHYRSVGSAPHLRFDERNCHAQSKQDNRYGSGAAVDYRLGLIARIGLAAVEALEADNEPKHYTVDQLLAMTAHYKQKIKQLKAARAAVI